MQALIIQPDSTTIAHIIKVSGPWTLEKVYGFDANARNPDPGQDTAFYLDATGVRAATKSKAIPTTPPSNESLRPLATTIATASTSPRASHGAPWKANTAATISMPSASSPTTC
jgi:hypothetical protein